MDNRKGVTEFDDAAKSREDYAARIARAKGARVPVGGAPMPSIPRLDQSVTDPSVGVQNATAAAKLLTPEQQRHLAEQGKFIPGVGSAYARNQPGFDPHQASKEATPAEPKSEFVNPPRAEGGLRPETIKGIEQLAKAQKDTAAETDAALKKDLEELDALDDTFELDEYGNKVHTTLNNKKRKDAIEARCEPMSIDDLILRGEVRQRVPVVPRQFEPTFRSVGGDEMLFIKRLMTGERGSDQYISDKFSVYQLTLGLYALNGNPLPSHLNADKDPDETLFKAKYKVLAKLPSAVLADLSVNWVWFSRRLEKLFVVDNFKGF